MAATCVGTEEGPHGEGGEGGNVVEVESHALGGEDGGRDIGVVQGVSHTRLGKKACAASWGMGRDGGEAAAVRGLGKTAGASRDGGEAAAGEGTTGGMWRESGRVAATLGSHGASDGDKEARQSMSREALAGEAAWWLGGRERKA